MKTSELLNKINNLSISTEYIRNQYFVLLQESVNLVLEDPEKKIFSLTDLILESEKDKIVLNFEVIDRISKLLGLIFICEPNHLSNVCFANSSEIRSEYRQSYRFVDLLYYLTALLNSEKSRSAFNKNGSEFSVTSNVNLFCKLVDIGFSLQSSIK